MSARMPESILDLQVQGLIERVARYRDDRCSELRAAAALKVREIVRAARAEARASVHDALVQERARLERGARQAEARADLKARQQAQHEIRALLDSLWREIEGALAVRWQNEEYRRAWIEAALTEAGLLLSGRAWAIERGNPWPRSAIETVEALAPERGARSINWTYDDRIRAGLRIRAGPVLIDATIPGLLAHHDAIESAFLAEYTRE